MTVLSADLETKRQDSEIISYGVIESDTIYKGALVVEKGAGYANPGDNTTGNVFLGVAMEKVDNESGASGAKEVRLYKTGSFEFATTAADQTDIGAPVYIRDDQTVDTTVTNSILCGYVVGIPDSTHFRVRIDVAVR